MDKRKEIEAITESVLFVSGESVSCANIAAICDVDLDEYVSVIEDVIREREEKGSGILIRKFDDKLKLSTNPEYSAYIRRLFAPEIREKLSNAVLETLAIVAYRQPVTRAEIESIRGVRCDYTISSLLEKGMIEEKCRKDVVGRPRLFGTSDLFLEHFGISDLTELPEIVIEEDTPEGEIEA